MTMHAWQPSLLGLRERPSFDPTLPSLTRIDLGGGAWLDHHPRWLRGHAEVFDTLLEAVDWQAHKRPMYDRIVDVPRLVGSLPDCSDQPQLAPDLRVVRELSFALAARYQWPFDRISLALYRDGRDSVAWHGDRVLRDRDGDTFVATVSVGEPRKFMVRPTGGGPSLTFSLGWGDLMVMGGTSQRDWQHSVPKVARAAGPRIVIMFR